MGIATEGFLDNMFDSNIERWLYSFLNMNAFTQGSFNFLCIVRLDARFICKNIKDRVEPTDQKERITVNDKILPDSPSSSSRLSDQKRYRGHARHYFANTKEAPRKPKDNGRKFFIFIQKLEDRS